MAVTQIKDGFQGGSDNQLKVNSDGSINIIPGGGFIPPSTADAIVATYPDSVTEVYTYKSGGVSGTTIMTVTITYTDATKQTLSTVVKS